MEDFARNRFRILDAAIDLEGLVSGMRACAAPFQYYFIDACRQRRRYEDDRLYRLHRTHTLALLDVEDGPESRTDLTVIAAASGREAGGARHSVSHYTQALLDVLNGRAASLCNNQWRVTSLDLYRTVRELTGAAPINQSPTMSVQGVTTPCTSTTAA